MGMLDSFLENFWRNFYFANPEYLDALYLTAIFLVLVLIVLMVRNFSRTERTYDSRYPLFGSLRFWFVMVIGFVTFTVLTLARPSISKNSTTVVRGPVEVTFLVGVSFSEFAQDWGPDGPSRMEIARREILNLLLSDTLQTGDKAAFYLFANGYERPVPLTDFQENANELINRISSKLTPPLVLVDREFIFGFSDIVIGLEQIYNTLDRQDLLNEGDIDPDKTLSEPGWTPTKKDNRLVFVFSDGDFNLDSDDTDGETAGPMSYRERFSAVLEEYRKRGIKIYPVGIGTHGGVRLAEALGRYQKGRDYYDLDEKDLVAEGTTRINPDYLRMLVAGTGGNTGTDVFLITEEDNDSVSFMKQAISSHRGAGLASVSRGNDSGLWRLFLMTSLVLFFLGWLIK